MPALFEFDDFDKCLAVSQETSPAFCVVNSFIKPNNSSDLYKFIHEFSLKEKQHFRHDKLQRGICLKDCMEILEKLGNSSEEFYVEKFPMDSKLTLDFVKFQNVDNDRLKLNHIINVCINQRLTANYNLTSYSEIEYCLRDDASLPTGKESQLKFG
jgi:hypothetical protein